MKASGSLTAGGGGTRFRFGSGVSVRPLARFRRWPPRLDAPCRRPSRPAFSGALSSLHGASPGLLLGRALVAFGPAAGMEGFLHRLVDRTREHRVDLGAGPGAASPARGATTCRRGHRCFGADFLAFESLLAAFFAARASSAALAGAESGSFFSDLASAVAARLFGPRMGSRGVKIQPTPGHGLAADQPSLVEEPRVLAVELLERVVGQHHGAGPFGDPQHEGVAPPDGSGRRGDQLAVEHGLATSSRSAVGHAVLEGGVDDHDDAAPRDLRPRTPGPPRRAGAGSERCVLRWPGSTRPPRRDAVQPMARRSRSACSSWCRAALPMAGLADSARLTWRSPAAREAGVQAGVHEGPGAHVLGLLLQPHHLVGLSVALEDLGEGAAGHG